MLFRSGENSFFKQLRFDSGNEEGGSSGGGGGGGGGADGPERAEAGGEGGGELSNEQIDPNKVAAIQRTTLDRLCRALTPDVRHKWQSAPTAAPGSPIDDADFDSSSWDTYLRETSWRREPSPTTPDSPCGPSRSKCCLP